MACGRPPDDALLFPNRHGEPWRDGAWQTWHRDAWGPVKLAVGIEASRPYDLRHSFASLLVQAGVQITEVARQLGHSATMCLEVYAHVFDEFDPCERVSVVCRPYLSSPRKAALLARAPAACPGSPS